MTKSKFTVEEKQLTNHWLSTAHRFLTFARGEAKNCKKRKCRGAGICIAASLNEVTEINACGLPLREEDVVQTVQLALFGMMLEEGLINNPEKPNH